MRIGVFGVGFFVAALVVICSTGASKSAAPADSASTPLQKLPGAEVTQPEVQVELRIQPRVHAAQNLEVEIIVRNLTQFEIGIPDNLALSPGRLLLNWQTSAGAKDSREIRLGKSDLRGAGNYSQFIPLPPFSYLGRKIWVSHAKGPCVRMGSPRGCDWPSGEYTFSVRMEWTGQSPALNIPKGVYESAPVKVVIEE